MREGITLMFDAQGTSAAWTSSDFAGRDKGVYSLSYHGDRQPMKMQLGLHLEPKWARRQVRGGDFGDIVGSFFMVWAKK